MSASAAPALKKEATDTNTNYSLQINTSTEMAISGHLLLKNGLFEGDLKLSEEFIRRYYNLSSILEGKAPNSNETDFNSDKKDLLENGRNILRNQRAAVRDNMRLWQGGRVPYRFSRNIPVYKYQRFDSTCHGPLGNTHLPEVYGRKLVWRERLCGI